MLEVNIIVKKLLLIRIQSNDKLSFQVYLCFPMDMVSNIYVNILLLIKIKLKWISLFN